MQLSEKIKRLRHERDYTQEALALRLNISPQAVSKWERGETLPDISLIIPIAEVLNVTTDELLGVNAAADAAKIKEYLCKRRELCQQGDRLGALRLLAQAYAEFPNNHEIMAYYSEALLCFRYSPYEEITEVPDIELIEKLCGRVLDDCSVPELRFFAAETLMLAYQYTDRKQKTAELANIFPENYYDTKFERLLPCLDGEERNTLERQTLFNTAEFLLHKIRSAKSGVSPEALKLAVELVELLG